MKFPMSWKVKRLSNECFISSCRFLAFYCLKRERKSAGVKKINSPPVLTCGNESVNPGEENLRAKHFNCFYLIAFSLNIYKGRKMKIIKPQTYILHDVSVLSS